MNNLEFPEESDSSDEDYVPVVPNEVLSEVESDGDPEEGLSDSENGNAKKVKKKGKSRKRKKEIVADEEKDAEEENESNNKKQLTEDDKKKHADSLWDSFKKDTNFKSVKSRDVEIKKQEEVKETVPKKIKVTEILEFAGEQMKVEKEVSADSDHAKNIQNSDLSTTKKSKGGLSSILSQIGKKTKITTLEKSKLDWEKFKKEENIGDELEKYNKGKNGYLERQDFLQRADLRRFEIEKEIRTIERNKRMNDV